MERQSRRNTSQGHRGFAVQNGSEAVSLSDGGSCDIVDTLKKSSAISCCH